LRGLFVLKKIQILTNDKVYEVLAKPVGKAAIREISKLEKWECNALAVPNLVTSTSHSLC